MSVVMTKAPGDRLDFDVDFSRWLSDGDTISTAIATISDTTAVIDDVEFSETVAKVWIHGGADTETGDVTVTIDTQQTRTKQFCFKLRIRECC